MKKRRILLSIVFGSMLAITGCGGDGDGDGTGATNGAGATGGGGGGSASNTCEAFCGSSCIIMGVDPAGDFNDCVAACGIIFSDECGSQAEAFVDCYESVDCDDNAAESQCQDEAISWGRCLNDFP